MAEDRAIKALVAGCEFGDSYSGWTITDALLQRCYLLPNSRGSEEGAYSFILTTFRIAAKGYLAADIAIRLCHALLKALHRFQRPLEDERGMQLLRQINALFTEGIDIRDRKDSDTCPEFCCIKEDAGVVSAVRCQEGLTAWFAAHLQFCETIVWLLCCQPKAGQGEGDGDAYEVPPLGLSDLLVGRQHIYAWANEAFMAAYRLACSLKQLQISASSTPPSACGASKIKWPTPLFLWTLPKAMLRVMEWSVQGSEMTLQSSHIQRTWALLWGQLSSLEERQWTLAVYVYKVLCQSDDYLRTVVKGVTPPGDASRMETSQVAIEKGPFAYCPPLPTSIAVKMAGCVLEVYATQLCEAAESNEEGASRCSSLVHHRCESEWMVFLESLLCFLEAEVLQKENTGALSTGKRPGSGSTDEAFKKTCRALCECFSVTLQELPVLDWMRLVEAFA